MPSIIKNYLLSFYRGTTRACTEEAKLGHITVPAGTQVQINMDDLHFSPELWGQHDPNKFVPERYEILLVMVTITTSDAIFFEHRFSYDTKLILDFLKTVRMLKIIWPGFHLALVRECV